MLYAFFNIYLCIHFIVYYYLPGSNLSILTWELIWKLLTYDWSRVITWPGCWRQIGQEWSHELDVGLTATDLGTLVLWLVQSDHVTWILASDWSWVTTWPGYWPLIVHSDWPENWSGSSRLLDRNPFKPKWSARLIYLNWEFHSWVIIKFYKMTQFWAGAGLWRSYREFQFDPSTEIWAGGGESDGIWAVNNNWKAISEEAELF